MARSTSNVNGRHTNGDVPPPSTLAAQIVQNQTIAAPQRQRGEALSFSELLQEILNNHAATPETDVQVNVKLISVVAQAGLGPLTDGNPFTQAETLLSQATDSLAVIESTIRRQPEVLFSGTGSNGPQLLLPLLSRLLAVCGRQKCEDLPVVGLLNSTFAALSASIDLWQNAQVLRLVIEDCVNDLLSALQSAYESGDDIHVKIPPARSVARLWTQSENAITLPHGCQTAITDSSHAFMSACELSRVVKMSEAWRHEVESRLQKLFHHFRANIERSDQLQPALQRLLSMTSNIAILQDVLGDITNAPMSIPLQVEIATRLMNAIRTDADAVADHLQGKLFSVASWDTFDSLHEDLKIAIATAICRFGSSAQWPERIQSLSAALKQQDVMTDSELLTAFQQLSVPTSEICTGPRKRKRRRVSQPDTDESSNTVVQRSVKALTGVDSTDLRTLPEITSSVYRTLNEEQQCAAWQALIDLAAVEPTSALETAAHLIELPELQQTKRPRVFSVVAMHTCIQTQTDPAFLDLRTSKFGQLCLRSLHSSLRELRFAAAECLPAFLRGDLPKDLKTANRKVALEYLRIVSDRAVASEQETLICAWGKVAAVCDPSELNLVLLRLVDYLGHTNPLISGLAFLELEKVASVKSCPVAELLRPFWSSIAVSVVQDLQLRPKTFLQQLCDLLGTDVNHWLVQTEQDTIPTLVLTKKKDILERIALAHGSGTSIQDICLQPRTNLASTLALLLAQSSQDSEEAAMSCLAAVSPDFEGRDISDFVKIDSTLIACYLLKHIGDQVESKKSRAYQAFQTFANIAERRPGQTKANSRSSRTVNEFFENHILGIMTYFSEVLENAQGTYPVQEKVRTLKAIAEMINLNKHRVNAALPQVRAALQSAMEHEELCEVAFSTWLTLLAALHAEDIAHVIDQSFALVLRHWPKLSPELQQSIHDRIGDLLKNHNQVIQENIMTLPLLRGIPLLAKFGGEVDRLKSQESVEVHCKAFSTRLRNESKIVVLQSLHELVPFLEKNQDFVHECALSEQPVTVLTDLVRALLDATVNYSEDSEEAAGLCGKALGIIGCLDPNRFEVTRKKRRVLVLSNFDKASEVIDWAIVLLEDVLVKAFKSVSNSRAQGFLAYIMQELLRFCDFNDGTILRLRASQASSAHQKWLEMPEHVRITLTPFVKSRYIVASNTTTAPNRAYPGFAPDTTHSVWLRELVYDLMWKAKGDNAKLVFPPLARVVRRHDLSIAKFMLPYAMLNIVLGGTVADVKGISDEIQAVLSCQPTNASEDEVVKLCSESVFSALDYISTWLHEKKKIVAETKAAAFRHGHTPSDFDEVSDMGQIDTVERFLASIPAEIIATQAVLCGSYARALFHWEKYIREQRPLIPTARPPKEFSDDEMLYDRLLNIYAQIDEPDGLEGISAHLPLLNEEQQAMQHVKAGRWTAAQAWYESQLAEMPQHVELEERLLSCLRETGRYAPLLRYADSFVSSRHSVEDAEGIKRTLLPTVVEAHWMTGDLEGMMTRLQSVTVEPLSDFNVGVANVLVAAVKSDQNSVNSLVNDIRKNITQSMTVARTSSIQASHEDLKKLHVLHEIEALSSGSISEADDPIAVLDRRLSVIGSYVSDKQYILGIRRAVMGSFQDKFDNLDLGSSWLMTAKLARHLGNTQQAYDAVLQASGCEDKTAKLEEARLLWSDGHQRHAIQALESSIASGIFEGGSADTSMRTDQSGISMNATSARQNMLSAKANLLLAKWLDRSGQSQAKDMTDRYQFAARHFQRWEKGHYYLGKHYQKLLDAEKALPKNKQSQLFQSGELTRLVVENQLRSVPFGNKYWHQTIPKILTLWLDLGLDTIKITRGEDQSIFERRVKSLNLCNKQLQKYFDRVPPYVFFSAVPQMISRITHPNPEVWKQLSNILIRIVSAHPSQALWSLLAVVKSTDKARVDRGSDLLKRLADSKTGKPKADGTNMDLRIMINQAQKLSDGLLHACEAPVEQRAQSASLSKDLGFNHKLAPCPLVVPLEATLTPSLPGGANSDIIRKHKAFVQDKITIQAFADYVLVLSSLQRPRKLTVRGSDGKNYGLLCKPKDDLRKDQRLMEFNGIINRALKRDSESSKRRLYIKTYAVTPLSEESGTIEWVEGIKPIRDILLNIYARKNIKPNYQDLRRILDEASGSPQNAHLFVEKVLPGFPASLHEWFTEVCPEPDAWFAARLRYARSAAVMSMTGHMLGLGDRHGENILLEESTGGVFHVDFNCLFDKGLTFEKPELVPFRLTHNMVDAMGPYGYEGPFRKSCELTLGLLRQSKDTLMTVLETFLYDPTTDFVGKKKKSTAGVPETPQEILESVDNKLKGLLRGETVPLGVEGYVDALIREAVSPWCLASMYIGWCAFL